VILVEVFVFHVVLLGTRCVGFYKAI